MNNLPRISSDELAELQAECDWLEWKLDEHKKSVCGNGEFLYNDLKEKWVDTRRRNELKKILKLNCSKI
ncbi:MAG TPA: hypothetical protein VK004_06395 [Ignavibacteria bacterium]|nr:hypothetical protein [Ignavibacteria bacterium]